jgi:hypothetical protein
MTVLLRTEVVVVEREKPGEPGRRFRRVSEGYFRRGEAAQQICWQKRRDLAK